MHDRTSDGALIGRLSSWGESMSDTRDGEVTYRSVCRGVTVSAELLDEVKEFLFEELLRRYEECGPGTLADALLAYRRYFRGLDDRVLFMALVALIDEGDVFPLPDEFVPLLASFPGWCRSVWGRLMTGERIDLNGTQEGCFGAIHSVRLIAQRRSEDEDLCVRVVGNYVLDLLAKPELSRSRSSSPTSRLTGCG